MKKIIKILMSIVLLLLLVVGGMFLFLTVTDYNPDPVIDLEVVANTKISPDDDQEFSIFTWNIGYGALGEAEDFFMDGGSKVRPDSKEDAEKYLENIVSTLVELKSDFVMIQEIDTDANRSYNIDQLELIAKPYSEYAYNFAKNYDVKYVPIPWPPMGKVKAGIGTYSKFKINDAKRYKFDSNYSWPKNTVMLDRCFSVTEVDLPTKDGDLLLINAHFSAYDDGTLRENQLNAIKKFIVEEYEKGNYVVLGGDWNQTFESIDSSKYPVYMNGEFYMPSVIKTEWVEEGWSLGVTDNAPTYRLLDSPYVEGRTQVGVIDGFLVSPNVKIEAIEVVDLAFKDSDHNPVKMKFTIE